MSNRPQWISVLKGLMYMLLQIVHCHVQSMIGKIELTYHLRDLNFNSTILKDIGIRTIEANWLFRYY